MITLAKSQQVKKMITQLAVCQIIIRKKYNKKYNPKEIQQIDFTGNLEQAAGATMLFIIEEGKEPVLDFSQGTVKVL